MRKKLHELQQETRKKLERIEEMYHNTQDETIHEELDREYDRLLDVLDALDSAEVRWDKYLRV